MQRLAVILCACVCVQCADQFAVKCKSTTTRQSVIIDDIYLVRRPKWKLIARNYCSRRCDIFEVRKSILDSSNDRRQTTWEFIIGAEFAFGRSNWERFLFSASFFSLFIRRKSNWNGSEISVRDAEAVHEDVRMNFSRIFFAFGSFVAFSGSFVRPEQSETLSKNRTHAEWCSERSVLLLNFMLFVVVSAILDWIGHSKIINHRKQCTSTRDTTTQSSYRQTHQNVNDVVVA